MLKSNLGTINIAKLGAEDKHKKGLFNVKLRDCHITKLNESFSFSNFHIKIFKNYLFYELSDNN